MRHWSEFEIYLRTGRRPTRRHSPVQFKFNPWHDPDDGRFTFVGAGRYFGGLGPSTGEARPFSSDAGATEGGRPVRLAQYRPNPRIRMGGNGGPPLYDPRTLEDAFPGLGNARGGLVIGLADNFLDLTGPARAWTTELALRQAKTLVQEIRTLQPDYVRPAAEPGLASSADGQVNLINRLRLDRAKAFYKRGELRPLQVEALRFLQSEVDIAYADGLRRLAGGDLSMRLSKQEALGNYVDQQVRARLNALYNSLLISTERGQAVQVNRRAPNASDGSYSVPDSRVGDIAFDVSLTAKTQATPQVRNFFSSDFQPRAVVIVRPSALGPNSTYILTKPGSK